MQYNIAFAKKNKKKKKKSVIWEQEVPWERKAQLKKNNRLVLSNTHNV